MESLPPELLHEICTLACTDGGFTGCSLSLVSKHIRDASRLARFHSVAISGTSKQLAGFLCCYNKERTVTAGGEADGYQPVVKHLFLAAADGGEKRKEWNGISTDEIALRTDGDEEDQAARRVRLRETALAAYRHDLVALFRLVSRDLQTLSFVHCTRGEHEFPDLLHSECDQGFPALQEFYLYGKGPFVGVAGSPVCFPQLTRLRLPFSPNDKEEKLHEWAQRAPEITHLCLSYVARVSQELTELSTGGGPFKKLNSLYLEPRGPHAPGQTVYPRFKRNFDNFLDAAVRPIIVLPYVTHRIPTEEAAMKEWFDRVGGGIGCWCSFVPRSARWVSVETQT
ncbi:hypothetical protein OH76DRAFT_1396777 [Lentinus brumalis]|uniref:F-box domain-containing protein n=1 Tax=Lentinus brumalis TaxID=2498619 RepID=A0A371DS81_9APHY|nr:hypothetical protein OH76DRAFT_1396777 [Polyporus brumalis]